MENFEKCTVAMLGGSCSQHVTGNTSRQNQPQSAIMSLILNATCWVYYHIPNPEEYPACEGVGLGDGGSGHSPPIAKTIGSTLIRHRSDIFASDRYLIDVDPRVYAIWDYMNIKYICSTMLTHLFRSLKFVFWFRPLYFNKNEENVVFRPLFFDPYFLSKFGKIYSFDPPFAFALCSVLSQQAVLSIPI